MFWPSFQKKIKKFLSKRNWDNRKIAFVSILIAVSVVFVLIMTSVLPFLIWPSLKISIGGLPIKITGYIFGPIIGSITGLVSDTLTFAFRPTYWHWSYMLAFTLAGLIPGIFGYFMNKSYKKSSLSFKEIIANNSKINKFNLISTLILLLAIVACFTALIIVYGSNIFDEKKFSSSDEKPFITNKWVFLGISLSGIITMFFGIFLMLFILKKSTINMILPIIAFSAILEITNTPLIALGDISVLDTGKNNANGFITVLTAHFLTSPVKIWINLAVIFTAYKIVAPLIFNKTANGWK